MKNTRIKRLLANHKLWLLCLCSVSIGTSLVAQKQKVWLDADTGNEMDDIYALARILGEPNFEVVGVSSAHFNNPDLVAFDTWNQYKTKGINTLHISQQLNEALLKVMGKLSIPHPLGADRQMGRAWGGRQARPSAMTEALIAAVKKLGKEEKLVVISLGALTNIASAIALDTSIAKHIICYALGAKYNVEKGYWNKSEFNIRNDLNAFDYLLDNPSVNLVIMPIDAAAPFRFEKNETYKALNDAVPLEKMLKQRWEETNPQDTVRTLWDLALVEAFVKPELATLKDVLTPPENTQRLIKVYTKIDVQAMKTDFLKALKAANAQLSQGSTLLPSDTLLLKSFAKGGLTINLVDVTDQPFKHAYRVSTINKAGKDWLYMNYEMDSTVHKGDVLLLSFYTRTIESRKETGEAFMEIFLNRYVGGKYNWPPLFERGLSFGSKWVLTQIPFVANNTVKKGESALVIRCSGTPQVFELAALSLINYKQSVKLEDLPKSVVHYGGDAPDAAWRKTADEGIEKYRKGNLTVKVLDKNGNPVPDATVDVKMKRSAFAWGTATNSHNLLDTVNPKLKIYRDTFLKYFNTAVFENEVKSKNWNKTDHNQTLKALKWLRAHQFKARGHVMVWPSWQNSPHLERFKNDTAALRAAILKDIDVETKVLKDQFYEWDVVNEPYAQHNIMDSLGGKRLMVDWFKAARKNTQGVRLFLNDYTMFHTSGNGSDSFYDNIKFLLDNHAPIEAIGEQSHIGGTPPGIAFILEKLDRFSTFGLPIEITEFDITSDDEDFKARYLKDYFTAIFSHPSTIGILQWGFWEGAHWLPSAALWDKNWHIRPAGQVFTELVTKTWATNTTGTTTKNGVYKIRAFNGDYEIIVKKGGKEVVQKAVLGSNGQTVDIKID